MTSIEFVDKLKAIAPSEESLLKQGLNREFINDYLNGYHLKETNKTPIVDIADPLLDLINRYDLSNLDIGMMRFSDRNEIMDTGRFIMVGSYDADVIAIDKVTDEVVILDSQEEEPWVMDKCSENTGNLLEALIEVALFNEKMAIDEDLSENQQAIKEKSMEIARIAGGDQYLNFYLTILGYSGE